MDNTQALQALYNAARLAPLNANDHDLVKKAAEQLYEVLKIKEVPTPPEPPKVA